VHSPFVLNQSCSETPIKIVFQQHRSDSVLRRCPPFARRFLRVGDVRSSSMYPAFDWSFCASGQHGYQRACDLISGQASTGHLGHQCSHAPGRPTLHLVFILSQTSAGKTFGRLALRSRNLNLGCLECPTVSQDAPSNPSELVGEPARPCPIFAS
jgi:hypothetical protein